MYCKKTNIVSLCMLMLSITATLSSCRKDQYEPSFLGMYDFTIQDSGAAEINSDGTWGWWDTTYMREGTIVQYEDELGLRDSYKLDDDLTEDPSNKVSVLVEGDVWINAQVSEDGTIIEKETWDNPNTYFHYSHSGKFNGHDSVMILYSLEHAWLRRFYKIKGIKN